jgi:hypothetical protein
MDGGKEGKRDLSEGKGNRPTFFFVRKFQWKMAMAQHKCMMNCAEFFQRHPNSFKMHDGEDIGT